MYRLLLLFVFCAAILQHSGAQRLPVQTYTTRDGLASNFITEIYQDSRGYLWIGTDEGISIFDGDKFKNLRFDDSTIWGYVNEIIESRHQPGTMWIATNGGGLLRFQGGRFFPYSLGQQPGSNRINSLVEGDNGSLWCATDDGIYRFADGIAERIPGDRIGTYAKFTQGRDGTIWCFDEKRLYRFLPDERKIVDPDVTGLPVDSIIYVSALPDSSVAIHVQGAKRATVYIVKHRAVLKKFELAFPAALFTVLDKQNRYWIGTAEGIQMIQEEGGKQFTWIYTTTNGLPVNELIIGYHDREQNIWFGSFGRGVTKLETQQRSIQFAFPGMSGKGTIDGESHVWIPSSHGLYEIWRDTTGQWKRHYHLIRHNNYMVSPVSVAVDSAGHLWITLADGSLMYLSVDRLPLLPSTLRQVHLLNETNGFPRALSISLFIDSRQTIWYGLHEGGIAGIQPHPRPSLAALFVHRRNTSLRDIRAMYEDRSGDIWLMGFDPVNGIIRRSGGGYLLDTVSSPIARLPNIPFRSVLQTNNGTYWFGSRYNGLYAFSGDTMRHYTVKDGLISNQIWSLEETPYGGILIGTQAGLMMMPDEQTVRFASLQQYTQSPVQTIRATADAAFAVTRFDVTMFTIPNDTAEVKFPPVLITSLVVNGKAHPLEDGSEGVELSSGENTLTIDYTAISFRNTGALRFQYKLEPLDAEWREATTSRSVTYANLAPGNYVFDVRAVNQEGKASDISTVLPIAIASPLWARWWFLSLAAVMIVGAAAMAERIRVRRLLEIEKIRSRIAADLHDDIGSGLTRIALLSDLIHRQAVSEKKPTDPQFTVPSLTEKVGAISRELVDAMSDVVWSIDPKNSSMERLLHRVRTFAVEVCEAKEIGLSFTVSDDIEKLKVGSDSIRAVLLVAKEALTNVVRHSNAKRASVALRSAGNGIIIEIEDDGKGFDLTELSRMNGLTNMRVRIEKNGGLFTLHSQKGRGTSVQATIPLH